MSNSSGNGIKPFWRGDTRKYTLYVSSVSPEGVETPISVDGGKLFATFKSDLDLPDGEAEIQVSVDTTEPDPSKPGGKVVLVLPASKTNVEPGVYWYDFQFVNQAGEVKTVLPEPEWDDDDKQVEIYADATRNIS